MTTEEAERQQLIADNDRARVHLEALLAVLDDKRGALTWGVRAMLISAAREFLREA